MGNKVKDYHSYRNEDLANLSRIRDQTLPFALLHQTGSAPSLGTVFCVSRNF